MAAGRGSMPLGVYKKGIDPSCVAVAKHFADGLDSADLADLVHGQLSIKTKAVYFHADCRHVALLLLDESINLNVLSTNELVTLAPLGPARGIVVDVPEGADLTMLQAYFDSDQSGVGGQYSHMDVVAGVLIIKIPNAKKVLDRVFTRSHILRHTELFIEPYYPAFHDVCFQLPKLKEPRQGTAPSLKNVRSRTAPPASSSFMEGCWFPECHSSPSAQTFSGRLKIIDQEDAEEEIKTFSPDETPVDDEETCKKAVPSEELYSTASDRSCDRSSAEELLSAVNDSDNQSAEWSPGQNRKKSKMKSRSQSKRNSLVRNLSARRDESAGSETSDRDANDEFFSRHIEKSEPEADRSETETDKSDIEADKSEIEDKSGATGSDDDFDDFRPSLDNHHFTSGQKSSKARTQEYGKRNDCRYPRSREVFKLDKAYSADENYVIARNMRLESGKDFLRDFQKRYGCELKVEYEKEAIRPPVIQRKSPPRSTGSSSRKGQILSCQQIARGTKQSAFINGMEIAIRLGDIAKEKADVIVNVVGANRNFQESAISIHLTNVGGPVLLQLLMGSDSSSNIIETSGGNLQCTEVYTLVLDHWKNITREIFSDVLDNCFKQCESAGHQSVSLPVIGTGRMLRFPLDVTVKTMVDAAIRTSSNGIIKTITIVAYEENAYLAFVSELQQTTTEPKGKEDKDTKKKRGSKKRKERVVSCSMSVSASKDQLNGVMKKLEEELRDNFLHTVKVPNPKQRGMPMRLKGRIYQHVNKDGRVACVNIDQKTGDVILKGEKHYIQTCKSELSNFFASGDFKLDKSLKCDFQFWTSLAYENTQTPSYWTNFPSCKPLSDVLRTTTSDKRVALVKVDRNTEKAVRHLISETWKAEVVGHGRDAINLIHSDIEVKKIERIENLDLFAKYALKRQEFFRSLSDDGLTSFPTLKELPVENHGNVMTQEKLKRPLGNELFPEINECYVFHGTKPEIIQTIIRQGLDYRMSSEKAMFGMGIYGAESSTKADQYADSKQNRTPGNKQMLILRMILGKSYICSDPNPKKFRRPPCTHPQCRRDDCTETHQRFDSVVGDGHWLFREFVVYAADQCYPEFLVTYERQ